MCRELGAFKAIRTCARAKRPPDDGLPGHGRRAYTMRLNFSRGTDPRMAIRIKSRHGETINQMLRRFKKLCEKEGLTKEVKRRQYYEKPSERARRDARRSFARNLRPLTGEPRRERTTTGGPGGAGGPRSSSGTGTGGPRRDRRPAAA